MTLSATNSTTARRTYTAGSFAFVAIGVAHTVTQLTTLSSDDVQASYRAGGPIDVNGSVVDGWHLFAGTSILMGLFSMAIGAINLAARRAAGTEPRAVCLLNALVLAGVATVGWLHLGWLQLYGGLIGIVLFTLPILTTGGSRAA